MKIAILLYDQMTALDAIGPYEVFAHVPGYQVVFVAKKAGPVTVDTGFLQLSASAGLSDVREADVLVIPGGPESRELASDSVVLRWIREIHETTRYTTSVCTGALILGAAGLLDGLQATTHWMYLDMLEKFGAIPSTSRVVRQGKIVTAAGVSAGIDMALGLLNEMSGSDVAQVVQLAIEYDPQPPFDAGSPSKAPAHVVALLRSLEPRAAERAKDGVE